MPPRSDCARSLLEGHSSPYSCQSDSHAIAARVPVAGPIRSVEVTHGPNGWHLHLDVLVFIRGEIGAEGLALLGAHVRKSGAGSS